MKKILICLLFVNIITNSFAQQWRPVTAGITFKIKMLGATVDGKFKGFMGVIKFDAKDLNNASLVASVDVNTLDTENNLRNRHLKEKEDFFNVAKYPIIKMKSTKIEKVGDTYLGYFDLTMKETTKNIKVPFTFKQDGNNATFLGSTTINRRDWAVGGGTLGLSNDVTFTILVNAIAQ
ncbi:YceI family protein [Arcicella sp. DC2W]|uniref:YceI family protein n=1 Tax=Arcicella gelida TaxID=2984195 RepID=A0ABU5S8A2_9BACT|nr:YceI family protein [Arcicella sp. DC2W]MEA5404710.1 YceI family protein [Arcicella sp. DC2W]